MQTGADMPPSDAPAAQTSAQTAVEPDADPKTGFYDSLSRDFDRAAEDPAAAPRDEPRDEAPEGGQRYREPSPREPDRQERGPTSDPDAAPPHDRSPDPNP